MCFSVQKGKDTKKAFEISENPLRPLVFGELGVYNIGENHVEGDGDHE